MIRRPPPLYVSPGDHGRLVRQRHEPTLSWGWWVAYVAAVAGLGALLAVWLGVGP